GEEVRRRQVGDHDLPALAGDARGDGPADAVGAAADDGHLAGETALSQCRLLGMTAGRGSRRGVLLRSRSTPEQSGVLSIVDQVSTSPWLEEGCGFLGRRAAALLASERGC